tara:strand:+ start:361 stop:690 length:330 start_codon:yes stop_codon:yes gene_type:complete
MNKFNKPLILILSLAFTFLTNCQGLRDNLSLKKKTNSDEFLVQKKNPLVLPPDYESLPKPTNKKKITKEEENEIDLSSIFNDNQEINTESGSSINQSLEDSIRKKIGTN